jgi:two-component sensor histidine kinase
VIVSAQRAKGQLTLTISDDGIGLPAGFDPNSSEQLGMQIVATLVSAELGGTVVFRPREGGSGTSAIVEMPLGRRPRVGG